MYQFLSIMYTWWWPLCGKTYHLISNKTWNRWCFGQEPQSCTEYCVVHLYYMIKLTQQGAKIQYRWKQRPPYKFWCVLFTNILAEEVILFIRNRLNVDPSILERSSLKAEDAMELLDILFKNCTSSLTINSIGKKREWRWEGHYFWWSVVYLWTILKK
jgi:hypothetical protein